MLPPFLGFGNKHNYHNFSKKAITFLKTNSTCIDTFFDVHYPYHITRRKGNRMKPDAIEKAIHASVCSLKTEGLEVDSSCIDLCRKMLSGEISMEEYLLRVTPNTQG